MSIADKLTTIAENEQRVYDAGKQAEQYDFWNTFQKGGNVEVNYQHAFSHGRYTDETYNPIYPLKCDSYNTTASQYIFYGSSITDTKVEIIVGQSRATTSCFQNCKQMHTIRKLTLNGSNSMTDTFSNCSALVNIEIGGVISRNMDIHWSPLSKASIKSIIEHLSDTESGRTLTLSESAVNTAFGINVKDETTYPEGSEYYNLRHSKDNWTISYS